MGHVSETETIFVVEFRCVGTVGITLTHLTNGKQYSCAQQVIAYRPARLQINGLIPGIYSYIVKFAECIYGPYRFKVPRQDEPLNIVFVSCNRLSQLEKDDKDLWKYIANRSDVDMIVHLGDQVYELDRNVWQRAYEYMLCFQKNHIYATGKDLAQVDARLGYPHEWPVQLDKKYNFAELMEIIKELYRSLYRDQWNHSPLQKLLATKSNHMILDDHDIYNGWGIHDEDRDPRKIEYNIAVCAHQAYQEYQAQLWRPITKQYQVDFRTLRHDKSAIFIMDVRNTRTFCRQKQRPYVGFQQMESLDILLSDKSVQSLVLVCSIPILLTDEILQWLKYVDVTCDIRDHWTQGENRSEHFMILDKLSKWKQEVPSRNLLLIGGDTHFFMETELWTINKRTNKKESKLGAQLITSPITNKPTEGFVAAAQNFITGNTKDLYERFRIVHNRKGHERNYAHVILQQGNIVSAVICT